MFNIPLFSNSQAPKKKTSKDAIFSVVNDCFMHHCIAYLNSIEKNWPNHPDILLHYSNLNIANKIKLKSYNKVILIKDYGHGLQNDILPNSLHPLVFNRLNLWSDKFHTYDNILHLDIDILILKPLDCLLAKKEFFIVDNKGEMFHDTSSIFNTEKIDDNNYEIFTMLEEDGLAFPVKMGNAGVFMIPKKYRNYIRFAEITQLLDRYKEKIAYADQSIISIWCAKNGIPVCNEVQFNYQPRFFRLPFIMPPEEASLIHFTSPYKPGTEGFKNWSILDGKRNFFQNLYNSYN